MGAADDRVAELLDRWLASVELHARYLSLDDDAYARVEDWPQHQRPTRWLVDIARARCEELRRQLAERRARRDEGFADALELMAFLTNLMGSEHVERFIPLATGRPPKRRPAAAPAPAPVAPPASAASTEPKPAAPASDAASVTGTVEVAKPAAKERAYPRTGPAASPTGRQPRSQPSAPRKPATESAPPVKSSGTQKGAAAGKPASPARDPGVATVIADAVRMLNWGREWPQLAGLIARLAGRPEESEVWKILRQHRAAIEAQAEHPAE